MYNAYIAKVQRVDPIEGADRIVRGTVLNSTVVVGVETKVGDMGVFFPCDGQLSEEFCTAHDLIAYKDEEGNRKGGYFDHRRRIMAQNFKRVKSEGFFMPLSCLAYTGVDPADLQEGMAFTEVNGKPICNKYISAATKKKLENMNANTKKEKVVDFDFPEHSETTNIKYVQIPLDSMMHVTLKMHGTSVRYGNVQVTRQKKRWFEFLRWWGIAPWIKPKLVTGYEYALGTRRAILPKKSELEYGGGFYGNGEPYTTAAKELYGKLREGEIVYGEVVGFLSDGKPLFSHATKDLKDKELTKAYGAKMDYHYGNQKGENSFYVYKITYHGRELTRYEVEKRCVELGVKIVPLLHRAWLPSAEQLVDHGFDCRDIDEKVRVVIETLGDGPDPIGVSHHMEGVCALFENASGIKCYKFKNHNFLVMEGLAKNDDEVDIEEIA